MYYLAVDSGAELLEKAYHAVLLDVHTRKQIAERFESGDTAPSLGKEYNVATAHIYAIVYYWRRRSGVISTSM